MTSISLSNCVDADSDEPRFRFQLDDLAILELAMAWPQLSSLHLGPTGWRRTSSTTLKGLKHLVQHCRYLAALSISVDAVNPPDTLDTAVDNIPTRCNELITTIDFMDSSVRDPCDVAAYLHFLFPRLVTIRREDYDDDALESWTQVERSLVSMNKARVWQSRMLERNIDTTTTKPYQVLGNGCSALILTTTVDSVGPFNAA
ncbi:hypothetical protein PHLCEN_2v7544 [Hermanssonia centrifuga]|uniref:Uncharacterized protein n=1 Tax=Hermanssonia centrifuga TaxID=98765 RepID=A0A2R6NWF6_9APHY|nr:hypothetical protein PHLCEN_2v7544 [Hermanssonia centrifuga]